MNYMTQIDAWFEAQLEQYRASGDALAFRKAVKDKILESYRNGQRSRRSKKEADSSDETK